MNKIYVIAIPADEGPYGIILDSEPVEDTFGVAIRDDGKFLKSHHSSGPTWTKHDLGITSDWAHAIYKKKCPNGYELEWVEFSNWKDNDGFRQAISLVDEEFPFLEVFKEVHQQDEVEELVSPLFTIKHREDGKYDVYLYLYDEGTRFHFVTDGEFIK